MAVLILLLFSPICVFSQTVQESGSGLVRPSQQLSLTCAGSGLDVTSNYMHWIRQAPGKGLEWIGRITSSGGTAYNDQLKSRITITRDTSKKQIYLQMTNMQTADTGVYYCARESHYNKLKRRSYNIFYLHKGKYKTTRFKNKN
ncbi:hypothetical protein GDO81_001796 [Engystomops pustulosus]|uniref:Ig-like domain-containing protein n=1 Tax=Engystomops pustulosus TaxID=76066 RepID=A0AAV7DFI1_ENGPU|nr:hypothetical protein GDO81_001796 [Engystomops pustulosus]